MPTEINFQVLVPPPLESEVPWPEWNTSEDKWWERGACVEYLKHMEGSPWTDAETNDVKRIALRVCWLECEVRQQCLTAALLPVWEPIGIYGGRNANQRRLLKLHWRELGLIEDDEDNLDDDMVE